MINPLAFSSTLASLLSQVALKLLSLLSFVVAQDGGYNFAARSVLRPEPGMLHSLGEGLLCHGLSNQPSSSHLFELLFPGSFVEENRLQTLSFSLGKLFLFSPLNSVLLSLDLKFHKASLPPISFILNYVIRSLLRSSSSSGVNYGTTLYPYWMILLARLRSW